MEPINVFARRVDPEGVVALLQKLAPDVEVHGRGAAWESATVTYPATADRPELRLTFRQRSEGHEDPEWDRQLQGMRGYFSRFPSGPHKADVLRLIGTFRYSLATEWEPDLDPDGDDRLPLLFAVARYLDGCLFTPSSLRDYQGRILLGADGSHEDDAEMPALPPAGDGAVLAEVPEEEAPEPPTAERVARRALALSAVTARALLEQSHRSETGLDELRQGILDWIETVGIGDELEPDEWSILQRPVGKMEQQDVINAVWRLEGLGVLAWALGRFELPSYDVLVDPGVLHDAVGFLDEEAAGSLLAKPVLRPPEEREALRNQLFALHWRLRQYHLQPAAMNFREFARDCWFGPLNVSACRFVGNDLALGDQPVHGADRDLFNRALSATMERHLAANWLTGTSRVYSETDTPT